MDTNWSCFQPILMNPFYSHPESVFFYSCDTFVVLTFDFMDKALNNSVGEILSNASEL